MKTPGPPCKSVLRLEAPETTVHSRYDIRNLVLIVFIPISGQCKHLEGGLDKLEEASEQLADLNIKLAEQKIVLAEKSTACEALLDEISTNKAVGQ